MSIAGTVPTVHCSGTTVAPTVMPSDRVAAAAPVAAVAPAASCAAAAGCAAVVAVMRRCASGVVVWARLARVASWVGFAAVAAMVVAVAAPVAAVAVRTRADSRMPSLSKDTLPSFVASTGIVGLSGWVTAAGSRLRCCAATLSSGSKSAASLESCS